MNFEIREDQFRGRPFKFAALPHVPASYETFADEREVRLELWTPDVGDLVLDIGAAYGSYALSALAMGAHVHAWAPQGHPGGPADEMEADVLGESLRLNGWAHRCEIHRFGLYDRTGWVNAWSQEFFSQEPPRANGRFVDPEILPVQTLDDWARGEAPAAYQKFKSANRIWFKLDVEGAEVHVLRGGARVIERFAPYVFVENHNFKRASLEQEVRTLLTGWGYREIATRPCRNYSHSLYVP